MIDGRRCCFFSALCLVLAIALAGGRLQGDAPARKSLPVTTESDGDVIHFIAQNPEAVEITATFEVDLVNLRGSTNFPHTRVFSPGETSEVFSVRLLKPDEPSSFTCTNSYSLGSNLTVHDDTQHYQLPYAPGRAYRVTQGYHGSFSHTGPEAFSIDWKMPEGTPVLAAREGVVIGAKDDSSEGGGVRYVHSANFLLLRHPDGTIGQYGHLQKDGNTVVVGQKVAAGEIIGHSGNTGFSSGPHLHFSVFKAQNGFGHQTIPVRFNTATAQGITLVSGRKYDAPASTLLAQAGEKTPTSNLAALGLVAGKKEMPQ